MTDRLDLCRRLVTDRLDLRLGSQAVAVIAASTFLGGENSSGKSRYLDVSVMRNRSADELVGLRIAILKHRLNDFIGHLRPVERQFCCEDRVRHPLKINHDEACVVDHLLE